ncbi:tRNA uracil 4-sulfurtransferase ThiI [Pelomicrobium sp.]|uniref:tRNA uracil 4-sulfurtransferase ThiI n=1 Tax=Pelomicrobium sp. TaxID=2815319 RepID=UPI002FDD1BE0
MEAEIRAVYPPASGTAEAPDSSSGLGRPDRLLVHYAEIGIKGQNRPRFAELLRQNIEHRLHRAGSTTRVRLTHDGLYVEIPPGAELEPLLSAVAQVPGIAWFAPAHSFPRPVAGWSETDVQRLEAALVALARVLPVQSTFKVRVKRSDKRFPLNSSELARRFGAAIIAGSGWSKVSLDSAERVFSVHIAREAAYLFTDRVEGIGGLPVGASGRVLALRSGGIDSPVAAYLMAKRGCRVDFLHVAATRIDLQSVAASPVAELARLLSRYSLHSRLFVVPSTRFDIGLLQRRSAYEQVLFRRFAARVAERLARRLGAPALVAGDSLGQVASQTLKNMVTMSAAVELPILRPLIAYDKREIIDLARSIGTYETSIRPYKDCCSLLSPQPRTASRHEEVSALESELFPDYDALVEQTLAEALCLVFDCGERVSEPGD